MQCTQKKLFITRDKRQEEVKSKMERLKTKDTYDIIDTEFFISEILQEE